MVSFKTSLLINKVRFFVKLKFSNFPENPRLISNVLSRGKVDPLVRCWDEFIGACNSDISFGTSATFAPLANFTCLL